MALDTASKRASAIAIGLAIARVWPIPDGSLANEADRSHSGYSYAMAASATVIPDGPLCAHIDLAATRAISLSQTATRAATITASPTRAITITVEVCNE